MATKQPWENDEVVGAPQPVVVPRSMSTQIQNDNRVASTTGTQVTTAGNVIDNNIKGASAPALVDNAYATAWKTRLEADELERRAKQYGLTAQQYAQYRDDAMKLPFMQSTLENLRVRDARDFAGVNPLEYGDLRPQNSAFNAVAARLYPSIKAAQNLTAGETNAATEQKMNVGALLPNSNDFDSTRQEKIRGLEEMLRSGAARAQQYGFRYPTTFAFQAPTSDWKLPPDKEQRVADALFNPKLKPEDAARTIFGIASPGAKPTEQDIAAGAAQVNRAREEMNQPGALWGGILYRDPAAVKNDKQGGTGNSTVDGLLQGTGSVVKGVGDLLGIVNNPANAILNKLGVPEMFGYAPNSLSTDTGRALRDATGLPANQNPMSDAIISNVTGAVLPGGLVRSGSRLLTGGTAAVDKLVTQAPKTATDAVLRSFTATPVTDTAVAASGTTAAEVVRQAGGGPIAQFTAALAAGAPAAAGGKATRFATEPGGTGQLAREASQEGITLMPADTGGTFGRSLTAGGNLLPLSAGPLEDAAVNTVKSTERAVQRNTDNLGGVLSTPAAGERVADNSRAFIADTMTQAGDKLKVLDTAAAGVRPPATTALKMVEDRIDLLNSMPNRNADEIAELTKLADDLRPGVNIAGLRELRTDLRSGVTFGGRIRGTPEQKFNKDLAKALGNDIEAGLAGNDSALSAYREFNKFYSGRAEIMDAFGRVVGQDKSGEQIVSGIKTMAGGRGDEKTLATVFNNMAPADANGLRATIIDGLGKSKPDAEFDLGTFTRNWESMPTSAKRAVFGDGEVYDSLSRIYRVAKETGSAQRLAANPSGTARGLVGGSAVSSVPLGAAILNKFSDTPDDGITFGTAAVLTAVLAGAQRGYGHLLANPKFASWLSRAPKSNDPLTVRNYIGRLGTIASQSPELAPDIQELQAQMEAQLPGAKKPLLAE